MSAARLLTRSLTRRHALGAGIGLTIGAASATALHQPRRLRFDSHPVSRSSEPPAPMRADSLDPELLRQMSGGSVAGQSGSPPSF